MFFISFVPLLTNRKRNLVRILKSLDTPMLKLSKLSSIVSRCVENTSMPSYNCLETLLYRRKQRLMLYMKCNSKVTFLFSFFILALKPFLKGYSLTISLKFTHAPELRYTTKPVKFKHFFKFIIFVFQFKNVTACMCCSYYYLMQ